MQPNTYQKLMKEHQETMKSIEDERLAAEQQLDLEIRENLQTEEDKMKLEALRKSIDDDAA